MALLSSAILSGLDASKPGSGFIAGRLYIATDTIKLYRDNGTAWVDSGLGAGGGGGGALTSSVTRRSSNVSLASVNTYVDALSLSLAAGTWAIWCKLLVEAGAADNITAKLWDGTTVGDSAQVLLAAINYAAMLPLLHVVTLGSTTTWKVSACSQVGGGLVLAATTVNSGGNNASSLMAIQIA